MKNFKIKCIIFLLILIQNKLNSQNNGWVDRSSNITDEFIDIRFKSNKGIIISKKNVYINLYHIDSVSKWNKITFVGTPSDVTLFNKLNFTQIQMDINRKIAYITGYDTINKNGVIFKCDLDSQKYTFIYKGIINTKLNGLLLKDPSPTSKGFLYAVGQNGLIVNFDLDNNLITNLFQGNSTLKGITRIPSNIWNNDIILFSDSQLLIGGGFPYYHIGTQNTGSSIKDLVNVPNVGNFQIKNNHLTKELLYTSPLYYYTEPICSRVNDSNLIYNKLCNIYNPSNGVNSNFLATNKGIYKLFGTFALEFQSSAGNSNINNIWFDVDTGYAAGSNGKIIYTKKLGGSTIPYIENNLIVSCLGQSIDLKGNCTSGDTCSYVIDSSIIVTPPSCNFFGSNASYPSYTFTTAGNHKIKYKVSKTTGEIKEIEKNIYIPTSPTINLPFSFNDTILCKSEKIQVTIQNTQLGYKYYLMGQTIGVFYGSGTGNGGTMTFTSDEINTEQLYTIYVEYPNTTCGNYFTTFKKIYVEKTKALIYPNKINITVGEPIKYWNNSVTSDTHKWEFFNNANIVNYFGKDTNVYYTTSGVKNVRLISTSKNNCSDTTSLSKVVVYLPPSTTDNCFAFNFPEHPHGYLSDDIDITAPHFFKNQQSFITCQYGDSLVSKSRYGRNDTIKEYSKYCINKYTNNGALQWSLKTEGLLMISSISVNKKNNDIYIVGLSSPDGILVSQSGDKISIKRPNWHAFSAIRFIMVLDSNGYFKWQKSFTHMPVNSYSSWQNTIDKIKIKDNNIYVLGSYSVELGLWDGVKMDTIVNKFSNLGRNILMKFDLNGKYKWSVEMDSKGFDGEINDYSIDNQGHMHIVGQYSSSGFGATFYDRNYTNSVAYTTPYSILKGFYVKVDSNGYLKNNLFIDDSYIGQVKMLKVEVDEKGFAYIVGKVGVEYLDFYKYKLHYSDNTVDSFSLGEYFILSLNEQGRKNWIIGDSLGKFNIPVDIFLNNNLISVVGIVGFRIDNSTSNLIPHNFTSNGGTPLPIKMNTNDFFIAHYDTSGYLFNVKTNVSSNGWHEPRGLIIDEQFNYYLTGVNINPISNSNNIFNVPLISNSLSKSHFIAKLNNKLCVNSNSPIANAGIDKSICIGDSTQIGIATTGNRYLWKSNNQQEKQLYTSNPYVKPNKTTAYYLTVVDSNGQFAYDTVNIFIKGDSISAGLDSIICKNDSIQLGIPNSYTTAVYDWTSNPVGYNSNFSRPFVKPIVNTSYFLSVTYQGCIINDTVLVSVSNPVYGIATINADKTQICFGDIILITSTIDSCGASPNYLWKKNGLPISSNENSLILNNLNNQDTLELWIQPSNTCILNNPVLSNKIIFLISDTSKPICQISSSSINICSGKNATFSANISKAGSNPKIEWYKGNSIIAGATDTFLNLTNVLSKDTIYCKVISSNICAKDSIAFSNAIFLNVSPSDTPKINISPLQTTICPNTNVTFKTSFSSGGTQPIFQWKKNGVIILGATDSIFTTNNILNNDTFQCVMKSNLICKTDSIVYSNKIGMIVSQNITPSISISSPKTTICSGETLLFSTNSINGGSTPSYQWKKNGIIISGALSNSLNLNNLSNNDTITCQIISSIGCASPSIVNSNSIKILVTPSITPTINILGNNNICQGSNTTFTAVITNGGSNPIYQWKKNGINVGTNNSTYTSSLINNNDSIKVLLTSNLACAIPNVATSNILKMKVNPILLPKAIISGITTLSSSPQNKSISSLINNAGLNPIIQWEDSTDIHSWQNIVGISSSSIVYNAQNGYKLRLKIISQDSCASPKTVYSNVLLFKLNSSIANNSFADIKIYPNPTSGILYIECGNISKKQIIISNELGIEVLKLEMYNKDSQININHLSNGIYYITIIQEDSSVLKKIVLTK